jgi:hypothetical protein
MGDPREISDLGVVITDAVKIVFVTIMVTNCFRFDGSEQIQLGAAGAAEGGAV